MSAAASGVADQGIDRGTTLEMVKRPMHGRAEVDEISFLDVVIAGYTGRDRNAVEAHITELEAIGVKRPAAVPVFYCVTPANLTCSRAIPVLGEATSGEVEVVICKLEDGLWVGAGSDHTDREAEANFGVAVSKQLSAKPIAPDLWRFADVTDHWDRLTLQSWATIDGERVPYQQGGVDGMLNPRDLLATYEARYGQLPIGSAMFCGTLAVHGGPRPAGHFEFKLSDPVLGRSIEHAYTVHTLPVRE